MFLSNVTAIRLIYGERVTNTREKKKKREGITRQRKRKEKNRTETKRKEKKRKERERKKKGKEKRRTALPVCETIVRYARSDGVDLFHGKTGTLVSSVNNDTIAGAERGWWGRTEAETSLRIFP